jgi:hypothetical protein
MALEVALQLPGPRGVAGSLPVRSREALGGPILEGLFRVGAGRAACFSGASWTSRRLPPS